MRNRVIGVAAKPALGALAAAMLLAGCSLAPTYQRPEAPIPAQWTDGTRAPQDATTTGTSAGSAAATLDWQTFVTDEELRGLIELALANNRSLRQTLLDVDAARALYGVQRADRLPGIEAEGNGMRQRVPEDLRVQGTSAVQSSYQAGVGLAAFELDLFGRVRSLSEAALQEYLATEEAARSAQISLVAEVIQAYLTRDGARLRYARDPNAADARDLARTDRTAPKAGRRHRARLPGGPGPDPAGTRGAGTHRS